MPYGTLFQTKIQGHRQIVLSVTHLMFVSLKDHFKDNFTGQESCNLW